MSEDITPREECRHYLVEGPAEIYEGRYGQSTLAKHPKAKRALNILLSILLTRLHAAEDINEAVAVCSCELRAATGSSRMATAVTQYALRERIIYVAKGYDMRRKICRKYALPVHLRSESAFLPSVTYVAHSYPAPAAYSIDYRGAESELARLQQAHPDAWTPRKVWYAHNRLYCRHYEATGRTGRLYHKPNGLNKELRPFLLIQGQPTAEVDITNAQPLFLACLLRKSGVTGAGIDSYVATVEAGTLYEGFAEWLTAHGYMGFAMRVACTSPKEAGAARKAAKALVFQAIFGMSRKRRHIRWVWAWLGETFPGVPQWIEANSTSKEWLSWELQSLEASIVLPVAKQFGALSIHDGIRCRAQDAEAVRTALADKVLSFGVSASIKVE